MSSAAHYGRVRRMSKYAPEGLNNMAWIVLNDLAVGGDRSYTLLMLIAIKTGLNVKQIVDQIELLARS